MDALIKVINVSGVPYLSMAAGIISIFYFIGHLIYDIFTKSDIEKKLSYRGRDRITTMILLFIFYFIIIVLAAFNEVMTIIKDYNLWIAMFVVGVATLLCLILLIFLLGIIKLILISKSYFVYEIKINDKEEYWKILKVTKDGRVILKKDDMYQVISDVSELNHKLIRVIKKTRKKKNNK